MKRTIVLMMALFLTITCINCAKEEKPAAHNKTATEPQTAMAADGGYSLEVGGIKLHWTLAGEAISIKLSAPTTGWVGIGFNPSEEMKDANYIIGYLKDGEVKVADHYGNAKRNHKADVALGGSDNVTEATGSEANGVTEIGFTLPLQTGDSLDGSLNPATDNTVLLAYGKTDRLVQQHVLRAKITLNLSTGNYQVLSVEK